MAAKNNKKYLFIICASFLIIGLAVISFEKFGLINIYHKPVKNTEANWVGGVNYAPPSTNDNDNINKAKQDGSIVKQPATKPINITLTRVYQDQMTRALTVRTLIEGQPAGECKLELVQNGASPALSKESNISQQNNIFVCEGFDIPSSDLPGLGEWTVRVTAVGGGTTDSASQNIILEK